MKRRDFLKTLGVAAGAVAFGGVTLPDSPAAADAWLGELFQVGDVFTIEGRYAFNPVTLKTCDVLQKFVVTTVCSEDVTFHPWTPDLPKVNTSRAQKVGGRTYSPPASACRVTA